MAEKTEKQISEELKNLLADPKSSLMEDFVSHVLDKREAARQAEADKRAKEIADAKKSFWD